MSESAWLRREDQVVVAVPVPPMPDNIWRILLDPETAKRSPGWVARFYERRPDLRPPAEPEAG
jgi:hypothetical protein